MRSVEPNVFVAEAMLYKVSGVAGTLFSMSAYPHPRIQMTFWFSRIAADIPGIRSVLRISSASRTKLVMRLAFAEAHAVTTKSNGIIRSFFTSSPRHQNERRVSPDPTCVRQAQV